MVIIHARDVSLTAGQSPSVIGTAAHPLLVDQRTSTEGADRRFRVVRLTVEDHGCGIPEDLRERVFDPFFTTKPRDKGTGLGLSISHGIVKDHGGQLWVESEFGQWTRFHVDCR